jgi:hypothetical protein
MLTHGGSVAGFDLRTEPRVLTRGEPPVSLAGVNGPTVA